EFRAGALGVGRRKVVRIARFAAAGELDRRRVAPEQEQRRPFTDVDTAAVAAERVAALRRGRLERSKAADGEAAERVDAARDRRVAQAELEQPPRREQRLRARGAGGGDGVGGAARAEQARGERSG